MSTGNVFGVPNGVLPTGRLRCLIFLVFLLAAAVAPATAELRLDFPVPSDGSKSYNAYTAPITSVLDHERPAKMGGFYCDQKLCTSTASGCSLSAGIVGAYTGEYADVDPGAGGVVSPGAWCHGFAMPSSSSGKTFIVAGDYWDGAQLSYDGHSGYDYPFVKGTPIRAPADGVLYKVCSDPINGPDPGGLPSACPPEGSAWHKWHSFRIVHADGFETWYLHSDSLAEKFENIIKDDLGRGAKVDRGEVVAYVGGWMYGPTLGNHLHFELRRFVGSGFVVLDPYGWEWTPGLDPFKTNTGRAMHRLDPIWEVAVPRITGLSVTAVGPGFEATVSGSDFAPNVKLTLWNKAGRYFCSEGNLVPSQAGGTLVTATLPDLDCGSSLDDYYLKVQNEEGPRSKPASLVTQAAATPVLTVGSSAPGGGTIVSYVSGVFDGISALSASNELHLVVDVDTDDDAIGDESRALKHAHGELSEVSLPSTSEPAWVRIGSSGHKAWGDGVYPQSAIYVESVPTAPPSVVAQTGGIDPATGFSFSQLRGPLAVSDDGRVAFQTSLFNGSWYQCCYLLIYDPSSGALAHVADEGGSTPAGGTFAISSGYPRPAFAGNGDLVFGARVVGASNSWGVFRYSPDSGLSTVLLDGDSGPLGAYDLVNIHVKLSVAGNKMAFPSSVNGGDESLFLVNLDDPQSAEVIALAGAPTGTSIGGEFGTTNSPNSPFQISPVLRSDESVVFRAYVRNSPATPIEPLRALFLWNRRETKKLFIEGDAMGGTTINTMGSFEASDSGAVMFLGFE